MLDDASSNARGMLGASVFFPHLASAARLALSSLSLECTTYPLRCDQLWRRNPLSSRSIQRNSIREDTNAPGFPLHRHAISISSSASPVRIPSGRFSAAKNHRCSKDLTPGHPRRRSSFIVLGWSRKPTDRRMSLFICPLENQPYSMIPATR